MTRIAHEFAEVKYRRLWPCSSDKSSMATVLCVIQSKVSGET